MTALKAANVFLFQWFFVRLTKCYKMSDKDRKHPWYSIQGWIVPCTGWKSDFVYLGKPRFLNITKRK